MVKQNMKNRIKLSKVVKQNLPIERFHISEEGLQKLTKVSEIALGIIGATGVLLLSAAAPNSLKILNSLPWAVKTYKSLNTKRRDQRKKITRAFYYLKTRDLIEITPYGDNFIMQIKEKGREKLHKINLKTLVFNKPSKWNKYWWLVMADIPTEMKSQADVFRKKIKELGMFTLQKSVWAYPYDVRDEVAFIGAYYGLDKFITTIEAKTLETEDLEKLTNHFRKQKII